MLLAVAGLDNDEIRRRTESLASGDWSPFAPPERLALQFAYRLTTRPDRIDQVARRQLTGAFGKHRALDLVWYASWCNYMTRVADAFQLPLEKENVFQELTSQHHLD
jgi:hypothetical protein